MIYAENLKYGIMINMVNGPIENRKFGSTSAHYESRSASTTVMSSLAEDIKIINNHRKFSFYAFFIGSPQLDF